METKIESAIVGIKVEQPVKGAKQRPITHFRRITLDDRGVTVSFRGTAATIPMEELLRQAVALNPELAEA